MKKTTYLINIVIIVSLLTNKVAIADVITQQVNENKKEDCAFHPEIKNTFDYKWRLSGFTNKYISPSPSPIKVNIIIERDSRKSEIRTVSTPFNLDVHEEYSHISVSKEKEDKLWHIALQHLKVSKCKDKKIIIEHELSSTEPLIVFRSYGYRPNDGSIMKIITSPNSKNIYNGNLKKHGGLVNFRNQYSGFDSYTYKYKYCPDSSEELNLLSDKHRSSLIDIAKLSYCYIKSGKSYREKLFSIIKFPLEYKIYGIDGTGVTKLSKEKFLGLNFCCGDVKPSLTKDGFRATFHRDRHGNGEGEYLYFKLDSKTNKWYLTGVGIASY